MGVPAHFFHMRVRAHYSNIMVPDTSAILRAQNSKFYILEISWKLYAGKFLGNHMLGNSWKLYAGKLFLKLYAGNYGVPKAKKIKFYVI